jgi:UDP-N-acetylglucosamine--N-acetylmuramyl-(pentapeptide) pyrophosphoryl-undecaprenol N-acetylglucosamine transferase
LPILATLDELRKLDSELEILYIGQADSMESSVAAAHGLAFEAIRAGKLRRYSDVSTLRSLTDVKTMSLNVRDIGRLVHGYRKSLRILREFQPDVVFCKGGYVSLPVGLAAATRKIPYVVHESDLRAGLSNRTLAKWATKVAVGFPVKNYHDLPKDRLVYTGSPVRAELLSLVPTRAKKYFGLSGDRPVILVTGGGLGSQSLNDVVVTALPKLLKDYQILHITGEKDIEHVRFRLRALTKQELDGYHVFSFLREDMPQALVAADVVVTRAGATTLAELAALGKPSLVIPHPSLTDQAINAKTFARAGAVRNVPQAGLTPVVLLRELHRITDSTKEQALLSKSISEFAKIEAASELAQLIIDVAKEAHGTQE